MKTNLRMLTNPAFIVFIGALISALGGWWATRKQDEESEKNQNELRERDKQIIDLQKKLIETTAQQLIEQRELRKKSDEIANLNSRIADTQKELYKKSEEIAKGNEDTGKLVSGEGSYCVVYILPSSPVMAMLLLMHRGPAPLHDLKINIRTEYDQEKIDSLEPV